MVDQRIEWRKKDSVKREAKASEFDYNYLKADIGASVDTDSMNEREPPYG